MQGEFLKKIENKEISTRINKIIHSSREAVQSMRDIVWAVNPGSNTFEDLLNHFKDFVANLETSIEFRFDEKLESPKDAIQAAYKQELLFIFKEAINNILKHGKEVSEVTILFHEKGGQLVMKICDNGKEHHIKVPKHLSSFGLVSIKRRAKILNGEATFNTTNGFCVEIRTGKLKSRFLIK